MAERCEQLSGHAMLFCFIATIKMLLLNIFLKDHSINIQFSVFYVHVTFLPKKIIKIR